MARLTYNGPAEAIEINGKVHKLGDTFEISEEVQRSLTAHGHTFEGKGGVSDDGRRASPDADPAYLALRDAQAAEGTSGKASTASAAAKTSDAAKSTTH